MWDRVQRLTVNRDHMIVIPRGDRPGEWFDSGRGFLAPLYRKRELLIDRSKWVHAWTLYNLKIGSQTWLTSPDSNMNLHLPIEIKARNPTGWYFTVPQDLRRKGWLPGSGGIVMYEYTDSEANFWTEAAYNEESVL